MSEQDELEAYNREREQEALYWEEQERRWLVEKGGQPLFDAFTALQAIARNAPPSDWEPYTSFGDPVDADPRNAGDMENFGRRLGRLDQARIAREALADLKLTYFGSTQNPPLR